MYHVIQTKQKQRPSNNNNNNNAIGVENDDATEAKSAPILKEKKSKRQIKENIREKRKRKLNSYTNIKQGKIDSLPRRLLVC